MKDSVTSEVNVCCSVSSGSWQNYMGGTKDATHHKEVNADVNGKELATIEASPPSPPEPSQDPVEAPEWCFCRNCRDMPTPTERVCCTDRLNTGCITIGEFKGLILNRAALHIIMEIRHDAFIAWQVGPLGRRNREVVPSCAVIKIRQRYPSADGQYTGYKESAAYALRRLRGGRRGGRGGR